MCQMNKIIVSVMNNISDNISDDVILYYTGWYSSSDSSRGVCLDWFRSELYIDPVLHYYYIHITDCASNDGSMDW